MSTLAYAALTTKRIQAERDLSRTTEPPGLKTYVDSLAALVPAEVLALHAFILTVTTKTASATGGGTATTTITDPGVLKNVFWALLVVAAGIYLLGRAATSKWKLKGMDAVRAVIPALAFAGWAMLQNPSAFNAAFSGWSVAMRDSIAVIGAVVLGALAAAMAYKLDQQNPPSA